MSKFYSGIVLPDVPAIDSNVYPYLYLTKNANNEYFLFCTGSKFEYDASTEKVAVESECLAEIYSIYDALNDKNWFIQQSQFTLPITATYSITEYIPVFANYDVYYTDGSKSLVPMSIPADYYWNCSDTEGKVRADAEFFMEDLGFSALTFDIYKIFDIIFSYDQVLTVKGVYSFKDDLYGSYGYSFDSLNLRNSPVMAFDDMLFICPFDNYTIENDDFKITFPEKGIYATKVAATYQESNMETIEYAFNSPIGGMEVLYDGPVLSVAAADYNSGVATLTEGSYLVDRDVLITTYEKESYSDQVKSYLDTQLAFGGVEEDNIDFSNRPYAGIQKTIDSLGITLYTETPGTKTVKIERYMAGAINKITRLVEVGIKQNLKAEEVSQITITSDNAKDDSPLYSYNCSSSYNNILTVSSNGVMTAKGEGEARVTVASLDTTNYHSFSKTFIVKVYPARKISIVADDEDGIVEAEKTTQLSVVDNASEESPTYSYWSSNSAIATVNETGLVTGVSTGRATITVVASETENFASTMSSIELIIVGERFDRTLTAEVASPEMPVNGTTQVIFTDSATDGEFTYSFESSNSDVAEVSELGVITAKSLGSATITVKTPATIFYHEGSTSVDIQVISFGEIPNDYTMNFVNENWELLYPDNYGVTNGLYPFYVDNLFGQKVLRSGKIGDSQVSTTTINFTLQQEGEIEFSYKVTSEANYDWLTISIDNVDKVRVSGELNWQVYSEELAKGNHTLVLKYNKDGGGIRGEDAGAIGYLRIKGYLPPFDKKYLIKSEGKLYTIENNKLISLQETEINSTVLKTYGFKDTDYWDLILALKNPEIFYWFDTTREKPSFNAILNATPYPQTIITEDIDMSSDDIYGIESITPTYEGNPLFACSFDKGLTWKIYDGVDWVDAAENQGMTATEIMAIIPETWYDYTTSLDTFKFRFTLTSSDDIVYKVIIDFFNSIKIEEGDNV